MPCRYDPTPEEIAASQRRAAETREKAARTDEAEAEVSKAKTKAQKDAELINVLSVQLDYTRDLLWRVMEATTGSVKAIDPDLNEEVNKALKTQEKHRQDDLDRLVKTLGKNPTKKNKERLLKVLSADVTQPLEPQLGFDPDSI